MVSILVAIAAKVAEYLVEPIFDQFAYLTDFKQNVENLNKQVERLEAIEQRVLRSVDQATRNAEEIEADVRNWVSSVDKIKGEAEKIRDEAELKQNCIFGRCPNCIYRYGISRKSVKKVAVITKLQEEGKFPRVSHPPPPPGIGFLSSADFMEFESRNSTVDKIMEELKDDKCDAVVLYGKKGIGKTSLVKEVGKKAKQSQLFDQVVMGVVDKTPNLRQIQGQLADMLGLKFVEESESGRARRLNTRLKYEKKILIILDDVWSDLELEDIGIPSGSDHKGCKILFTTQNQSVCSAMGLKIRKIPLKVLSEGESWDLFKRNAGEAVDSPTLNAVAKEVVEGCGGLPSMLVGFGKKLRNKKIEEWMDVCRQLKKSKASEKEEEVNQEDLLDEYN